VIHGTILNHSENSIVVGDSLIALNKKGAFRIEENIVEPTYIKIKYSNIDYDIFVEPNEQLSFIFNGNDFFGTIEFEGKAASINSFLIQEHLVNRKVSKYFSDNFYEIYTKDESEFVSIVDSLRAQVSVPFEEFVKQYPETNKWFITLMRAEIKYSFDKILLDFPFYQLKFKNIKTDFTPELAKRLYNVELNKPELLESEEFVKYALACFRLKIKDEIANNPQIKKSDNKWLEASFNVVLREIRNQQLLDFFLNNYLFQHIENNGIKNINRFITIFNEKCKSVQYKKDINDYYLKELANRENHIIKTYKTVDGFNLDAHIFIPKDLKEGEKRPALVYFHGGSWSEGKPDWGFGNSKYGFVVVCIEYRYYDRYGTLPFEGVSDAKSAIRWIRKNADELNIDGNKIIATGNSAGGHLALCTAIIDALDEQNEDLSISSKPNALILKSAVYDPTRNAWFEYLLENKNDILKISPIHNVKGGLPPTIIFHSTDDPMVHFKTAKDFANKMKDAGNDCILYELNGLGHFIWWQSEYYKIADPAIRNFYKKLGYL
jgi:acetyl esterase/lipase